MQGPEDDEWYDKVKARISISLATLRVP